MALTSLGEPRHISWTIQILLNGHCETKGQCISGIRGIHTALFHRIFTLQQEAPLAIQQFFRDTEIVRKLRAIRQTAVVTDKVSHPIPHFRPLISPSLGIAGAVSGDDLMDVRDLIDHVVVGRSSHARVVDVDIDFRDSKFLQLSGIKNDLLAQLL